MGARGSIVGWGTALQTRRLWVWFPVIGFFHWHNPSGRTMALGLTQPLTEMSTRGISWGLRRPVRRADNLTIFMCWLSWNLGASTSWNPQGLSRPVMGLLYLYLIVHDQVIWHAVVFALICVISRCGLSFSHESNYVFAVLCDIVVLG
jgi:hypothetical protein